MSCLSSLHLTLISPISLPFLPSLSFISPCLLSPHLKHPSHPFLISLTQCHTAIRVSSMRARPFRAASSSCVAGAAGGGATACASAAAEDGSDGTDDNKGAQETKRGIENDILHNVSQKQSNKAAEICNRILCCVQWRERTSASSNPLPKFGLVLAIHRHDTHLIRRRRR